MNNVEKQKRIDILKSEIDDILFKIDASRLKIKFSNEDSIELAVAWQTVFYTSQIKMIYAQIQTILAIPNNPKGGIAIIGNSKPEILRKPNN